MSKILLINPQFNIKKAKYDSSISVGILCLASYLDQKGIEVKIIDCVRQNNFEELLAEEISQTDFVGLSVMTTQIPSAIEISIQAKEQNKKVIWGGVHPTLFPKETVSHLAVDGVVIGEGEEILYQVLTNDNWSEVLGLAYQEKDEIMVNDLQPLLDMEGLPLPKWELMPREILANIDIIPTHTSRGCPHRCSFCINQITKNYWRKNSVQKVLEDIKIIKSKEYFKDKPLRFWDENFFVDFSRAQKIIQGMIEQDLTLPWETTVRADYIDIDKINDTFLSEIKKSGCYLLSFGAESGSEVILSKLKKDITTKQIINSAKQSLKHDITPQYSFMVGIPGEAKNDIKQTINLIDQLVKISPQVQILGPQAFRPYPGSELYQECIKSGWQAPKTLEDWSKVIKDELNYLAPKNFLWIKNKNLVESLEAYVRFGAHSIKSAMGSTVSSAKWLKLCFILICKLRWKLKFFGLPLDYKLAKRFVTGFVQSNN